MLSRLMGFVAALAIGAVGLAPSATAEPEPDVPVAARVATVDVEPTGTKSLTLNEYQDLVEKKAQQFDPSIKVAAAAAGCWDRTLSLTYKNVFGAKLFRFNQRIAWCGDGHWVRSTRIHDAWGNTYFPGWNYKGAQKWQHYGVNWNIWEANGKGFFCWAQKLGCVHERHPLLRQTGGGGGGYWTHWES